MDAVGVLIEEHVVIKEFIETLNLAERKLEAGERIPGEFLQGMVEFARDFVDRYHHGKEETQLFVQVAQLQAGEFDGALEALRQQHEHGRDHIAAIAASIDGYEAGDPLKDADVLEHLAAYTSMLRLHVHREDHVFFPMARMHLDDGQNAALLKSFELESTAFPETFVEDSHLLVQHIRGLL